MIVSANDNTVWINAESKQEAAAVNRAIKELINYKTIFTRNGVNVVPDKEWYAHNKFDNFYIIPSFAVSSIGYELIRSGIPTSVIRTEPFPSYKPRKVKLTSIDKRQPRDYQKKYISHITDKNTEANHLVTLQTGKGKTLLALKIVDKLRYRTIVVVLAKYLDKWREDISGSFQLDDGDILTVRGSKELQSLFDTPEKALPPFILIGTRTLSNYYKEYENNPSSLFKYSIKPQDMSRKLRLGTLLLDEIHSEFYICYMSMLYFNVPKVIGLSATFYSNDKQIERIMNQTFPLNKRLDFLKYDKYANVYAVRYSLFIHPKFKYKITTRQGYSHNGFENVVLNNVMLRNTYANMILHYVEEGYIKRRVTKDGDKLLIFCSTVDMCDFITNKLREAYPKLFTNKYTQEDSYSDLLNADITVSTILSSGTAVDIPNLFTVINTISVKSIIQNLQSLGRLRKRDGKELRYYYFYNSNIPKQIEYHKERVKIFKYKVVDYKFVTYYNT